MWNYIPGEILIYFILSVHLKIEIMGKTIFWIITSCIVIFISFALPSYWQWRLLSLAGIFIVIGGSVHKKKSIKNVTLLILMLLADKYLIFAQEGRYNTQVVDKDLLNIFIVLLVCVLFIWAIIVSKRLLIMLGNFFNEFFASIGIHEGDGSLPSLPEASGTDDEEVTEDVNDKRLPKGNLPGSYTFETGV